MISITPREKEAIQSRFPKAHIARTMKKRTNRHRYYCEETPRVMQFLFKLRNGE